MLWPGASMSTVLFWQWYNQSYNVAVNYANKNAAGELTDTQLAAAYTGAVSSSIGIALGMSKASDKLSSRFPTAAGAVRMVIPFCAVVAAGTASLLIVRQGELKNGVQISDAEGTVHGSSIVAAKEGLAQCTAARVLWNIPTLIIPPIIISQLDKKNVFRNRPRTRLSFLTAMSTVAVVIGLYPAQAVFAQRASISADSVEPQFREIKNSKGQHVREFFYNKGL